MKILMESQSTVKLVPDNEHEKESLDALWKVVIRCDADRLAPLDLQIVQPPLFAERNRESNRAVIEV